MQRLYRNGNSGTVVSLRKNVGHLCLILVPNVSDFRARIFSINVNILSILLQTFTKVVQIYHSTPGYWVKWAFGNINEKVQKIHLFLPVKSRLSISP